MCVYEIKYSIFIFFFNFKLSINNTLATPNNTTKKICMKKLNTYYIYRVR